MRDYTFYNPDYSLEHQAFSNNAENQHNSYQKYDYPGRYKKDVAGPKPSPQRQSTNNLVDNQHNSPRHPIPKPRRRWCRLQW
jgi:uncharacterized protein involved in type VI secretion and phage assembly